MPEVPRLIDINGPFSLATTCGPAAWGRGKWPNLDWIDDAFVWVGWEGERLRYRIARQPAGASSLQIDGSAESRHDRCWAAGQLGIEQQLPEFDDPVMAGLAAEFPGLRVYANGSLFDGLVTSIVGQSISVQAAAVTERRLCALFHPGLELSGRRFWPAPRPEDLATATPEIIRTSGVTMRRAEALVAVARAVLDGSLPTSEEAFLDPEAAYRSLVQLRLVGPWTARSTLLWGLGVPDAHPTGDVALLRAAKQVYDDPTLTLAELDRLAERWRPNRGWAARLLWTKLLGPAPI